MGIDLRGRAQFGEAHGVEQLVAQSFLPLVRSDHKSRGGRCPSLYASFAKAEAEARY